MRQAKKARAELERVTAFLRTGGTRLPWAIQNAGVRSAYGGPGGLGAGRGFK